MSTIVSIIIVLFCVAVGLMLATMLIGALKNLQRTRFPQWTFLDYISVGYARHLFLKYVKKQ
jgi:hypothetical protein